MILPMRYTQSFTFVALLLLSAVSMAVPQGPVIGKVTLILGSVTSVDQDGDVVELTRGSDLHAGFTLETAARSFVRAEMNDGTRFTLAQNTSATLDSFSFNETSGAGGFNATVREGGFNYTSGRLGSFGAGRQHSMISTPSGVIGVRGTVIEAVLEGGKLTINIPQGNVDITFTLSDGSTVTRTVGVESPVQIVQVSSDEGFSNLDQLPPELVAVVQVLEAQVRQAEADNAAADGADGGESSDSDEGAADGSDDSDATAAEPQTTTLNLDTNTLTSPDDNQALPGGGQVIDIPASPSTVP